MPVQKRRQKGLISHICGSFSNDIMAVKGLTFFFFLYKQAINKTTTSFGGILLESNDTTQTTCSHKRERQRGRYVIKYLTHPLY